MTRVVIVSSGEGCGLESTVSAVRSGAVAAGADIRLRRVANTESPLDEVFEAMVWADGIVVIAASHGGAVAPPVRRLVDVAARRRERLRLPDKVVAARAVDHDGGHGAPLVPELYHGLLAWDCLLLPGSCVTTPAEDGDPSAAEALGRRLTRVARSLRAPHGPALRRAG